MIYGCKDWKNPEAFYIQTNNPTEDILRKSGLVNYLETCGPTAAVNCLAAMGRNVRIDTPGGYLPQPEEILTDFFNDPRNYPALQKERPDIKPTDYLGNQVPQYYPLAIKEVFGCSASFTFADWNRIVDYLKEGMACQICFVKPGHFVAAIAYDDTAKEIIYNDPMGKFHARLPEAQQGNIKNYCIYYH